jgi:two-component system LytT family sensor kinase
MPSWYTQLLLFPAVAWLAERFRLDRGRRVAGLAVHVPASFVYGFLHLAIASWLSDYVFFREMPLGYAQNLKRLVSIYFVSLELAYYWAFVGIVYMVDYRRRYREGERAAAEMAIRTSRLESSLANARLEALRSQINPHFLFNTLNSVSVLAMKGDRHGVVRMLARLSDLLRMALESVEQTVTLADELAFLEPYLELEQVRFRDRLTVVRRVPPELLDAVVPSLLLQPLVENAIRHGIARRPGPGTVEIGARSSGATLVLEVRDTGPGPGGGAERGDGVGLANVRARLDQLHGGRASLDLARAAEGGAVARVVLPLELRRGQAAPERTGTRTA